MYKIEHDRTFQKYLRAKHSLSEYTRQKYIIEMNRFCEYQNRTFTTLIKASLEEQNDRIDLDNRIIIRFNKETSTLADTIEEYVYHCRENNDKENTIRTRIRAIYSILHHFNIETPRFPEFEITNTEWAILNKRDIQFLLKDIGNDLKPLLMFLACTGERVGDAIEWKIQDHLQSTFDYHGCTELDEYLDKPFNKDTVATYEFYPAKTRKNHILCRHGVTPETCEAIYNYLKSRRALADEKYENGEANRRLSKRDYLFVPRGKPLGKRSRNGIKVAFHYQNRKLRKHYIERYDNELKTNRVDEETYLEKVSAIPKFHAHALRKYFITTVRTHCSNLNICVQMEGHALPLSIDEHYVKIDREIIREEYFKLLPHLSFNDDVEVRILTDERILEYEAQLEKQQMKLDSLEELVENIRNFEYD